MDATHIDKRLKELSVNKNKHQIFIYGWADKRNPPFGLVNGVR